MTESKPLRPPGLFGGFGRVCLLFVALMLGLKLAFLAFNWRPLRAAGWGWIGLALLKGLRFDAAAVGYLLLPASALYLVWGATRWRGARAGLLLYMVAATLAALLVGLVGLQYFEESGKHMTYEATAYLSLSAWPMVAGGFQLHPWLSSFSLAGCAGVALGSFVVFRRLLGNVRLDDSRRRPGWGWLAAGTWPLALLVSIHGGEWGRPLHIGHASLSPDTYVNGLCLNPVYAAVQGAGSGSAPEYRFYDTASNVATVRGLVFHPEDKPIQDEYPLLRRSAGTPWGNRRNVVLFILESWTARDVGGLGGPPGVTPHFDELARQGAFFDRFYATGLRSSEGIFSCLSSFPNQPLKPIADRPQVFSVRWRSLAQILDDAGYDTVFLHGRSLSFDQMRNLLKFLSFRRLIERDDFPRHLRRARGAWPGYDDEEVMKRAHQVFVEERGRPFFGVIYTMNTHPPFMTPEHFPKLLEPTTAAHRFLNSLHYSDHTLKVFFDLARDAPYFTNTVFLFVADHSRTRDTFHFENQHHIPFLIYAPGHVTPGRRPVVGGQLDILPTVLGLLDLQTRHAAWGQDLLRTPEARGFAVSVSGNEVRWHDRRFLLHDGLTDQRAMLFDLERDPTCRTNVWSAFQSEGERLQRQLRAHLALSQTLLFNDRVYPRAATGPRGAPADGAAKPPSRLN